MQLNRDIDSNICTTISLYCPCVILIRIALFPDLMVLVVFDRNHLRLMFNVTLRGDFDGRIDLGVEF